MSEVVNTDLELKEHTEKLLDLLCPPVTYTGLRRLFYMLTESHFAFPDNHGPLFADSLACVVSKLEDGKSGTVDVALEHTTKAGKDSPSSIRIGLSGGSFQKGGLGDYAGHSDDNSARYQTKIGQAQIRVRFRNQSADIALMMAESTMAFYESLRETLMTRLRLHSLDVVQLTDIDPEAPEPDNIDAVTLLINIQFDFSVALVEESHRLKKMAMQLNPGP